MGHCCSKQSTVATANYAASRPDEQPKPPPSPLPAASPARSGVVGGGGVGGGGEVSSLSGSPFPSPLPAGVAASPSPARTPLRKFRWPLPPPSPARPIMSLIAKRRGRGAPKEGPIAEEQAVDGEGEPPLDKSFGYAKNFCARFELGKEVGRGHFGHTCWAKGKKGELKGQNVAVKIISKAKMTSAISIEDVRREVKILKGLAGHKHLIRFHDAFEDNNNVYIVMELCEGGELLDRILSRGGRYREGEAKDIVIQILSVVAYFHLQGVVHRDLKPENFLFSTRDEDAPMKIIDFGLSDFIGPGQRLSDVVGSAYYVAPEVLHRSYSLEADMWSIGVITYILLCGSRPFWARTESGIFRSVLRADPNFHDSPWPTVSAEARDFVKRLLNKDYRKRMTAAQALTHPWIRDEKHAVPLDISIYKLVKYYVRATPFKRSALKALSKALTEDELVYLRAQYNLLEPKNGYVSLDNFKVALMKNLTEAMKESRVPEILDAMEALSHKKMGFEEFCAAAISPHQLEGREDWDQIANTAFEYFEQEGNRVISLDELSSEVNLDPRAQSLLDNCIRSTDGKLSFLGYTKFLHGVTLRNTSLRPR
ncbi:CDPK-related kinase 4 isoform X1 [Eucalyptus grandis]|uniref:CDPK-related kinase 4 isoform X1 n=2 Tax=Eucalyptus grandis TaxID=71139 RepID=UPI00192EF166|nr:CDPK-related kinase 4 isoform X1 [Eucalyptus grandis]